MAISLAPPPLQIPPDFAADKLKGAFFGGLINTLYQLWTSVYQIRTYAKVKTTDASVTGIVVLPIATGRTMMVKAMIVAQDTVGNSAFYELTGAYKNVAGVLTGIGTPDLIGGEDVGGWNVGFTTSGTSIVVTVTGAAATEITWEGTVSTYLVGA